MPPTRVVAPLLVTRNPNATENPPVIAAFKQLVAGAGADDAGMAEPRMRSAGKLSWRSRHARAQAREQRKLLTPELVPGVDELAARYNAHAAAALSDQRRRSGLAPPEDGARWTGAKSLPAVGL